MTDLLLDANWLARFASFSRLYVGFSGGLDSTVLLHRLGHEPSLVGKLTAVHVHHGLSQFADDWQKHCQVICAENDIPLIVRQVHLNPKANVEEQARNARFAVFSSLVCASDALVLAHHADDQAETVLLQLMRGAGVDGLAGMPAIKAWSNAVILRPLLAYSRETLEAYARFHCLNWIEDDSNQSLIFSRNYLRHQVMPLLRDRWPGVVGNLARTALHCQQAKRNLDALAVIDAQGVSLTEPFLSLDALHSFAYDRVANILRNWIINNQLRLPSTEQFKQLMTQVLEASVDSQLSVAWDGVALRRYQNTLYLLRNVEKSKQPGLMDDAFSKSSVRFTWCDFPDVLELANGAGVLTASLAEKGMYVPKDSVVEVGFRQGGERIFWRGQHKVLKKLLQQWQVLPWERDRIPLIWIDNKLAAVVGFAISDPYYGENSNNLYNIEHLCQSH